MISQCSQVVSASNSELLVFMVSLVTLFILVWQVNKSWNAAQLQVYIQILERAQAIQLSEKLDKIRKHDFGKGKPLKKYEVLVKHKRDFAREVREVADFFNNLGHLMRYKYVDDTYLLNIYYISLLHFTQIVGTWWIAGFREKQKEDLKKLFPADSNKIQLCDLYYTNLETLMDYVLSIQNNDTCANNSRMSATAKTAYKRIQRSCGFTEYVNNQVFGSYDYN